MKWNCPPWLVTFFQAYVEAILLSTFDENEENLDRHYTINDLSPDTAERIIADCTKFVHENHILLMSEEHQKSAGQDFYWSRQGNGSGFYDGDWAEPAATLLTTAANEFGRCETYLGVDGLIHSRPLTERGIETNALLNV